MDFEETMVPESDSEVVDEVLPEDAAEDSEESEESLESIMDEGQSAAEEPKQQEPQGTGGEPGWFRTRWDKEVGKLTNKIREEVRNEYEAQFAPMRERLLEMDAQDLVRSGKVKDLETAKELVRYRNGQPAAAQAATQPAEQPRQANGQFAQKSREPAEDPAVQARIQMLEHQAGRINAAGGVDVIGAFQSDEEIKNKVVSGEWDFYDVADYLKNQKPSNRRPPSPVRSPNGVNGQIKSTILSMTDKQFDMLEKRVKEGGTRFRE